MSNIGLEILICIYLYYIFVKINLIILISEQKKKRKTYQSHTIDPWSIAPLKCLLKLTDDRVWWSSVLGPQLSRLHHYMANHGPYCQESWMSMLMLIFFYMRSLYHRQQDAEFHLFKCNDRRIKLFTCLSDVCLVHF